MTNQLVGDVYAKIIEEVIAGSKEEFEHAGVGQGTLQELQQAWQTRLSSLAVAQMPWDPKPIQQQPPAPAPAPVANGLPSSSYPNYEAAAPTNGARVKTESSAEPQYNGLPNGYPQPAPPPQGGIARAQQLVQQQYGAAANASLNAMQRGGGLALPGQQPQARPQGLQLPGQSQQMQQPQYIQQQQQQAAMQQRQQQQLQQQQQQPRIKMENESPKIPQGSFQQHPNYSQTDGAGDMLEWQEMLAQRRAVAAEQQQHADRVIRDQIMQNSADLESGLMMPLNQLSSGKRQSRKATSSNRVAASSGISQLDGVAEEDADEKPDIKDEDDENAINSDLDDSDDEAINAIGDDEDDGGDSILCTYDKVQRVKNKWKCTLKDGIMAVNGKEWVFHKGTGEFEW